MLSKMMIHNRAFAAVCIIIVLALFVRFHEKARLPASSDDSNAPAQHGSAGDPSSAVTEPSDQTAEFWGWLLDAFQAAKPQVPPIVVNGEAKADSINPEHIDDGKYQRPDLIKLSHADAEGLKKSHADFVAFAHELAGSLPYKPGSKGIVMTSAAPYLGIAITSVSLLRRTGCKLPVQIYFDKMSDVIRGDCEGIFNTLGVECVNMEKMWQIKPQLETKMRGYQFKVLAMVFSQFQQILFLDADAWPLKDPDYLFQSEPFTSHGLITWPDVFLSTVSTHYYPIAQVALSTADRKESSESGIVMYDKGRHASSLLLATYYNYWGYDYYYHLLCQRGHGAGDKETFLYAAMAMKLPYYEVKTRVEFFGRHVNGSFQAAGLKHGDPKNDYELATAAESSGSRTGRITASRMFIHHLMEKIDVRRPTRMLPRLLELDATVGMQGLWANDTALWQTMGYNPEADLWKTILDVGCGTTMWEECDVLRAWFSAVFESNATYKAI
jgi:alpha 1,2-mannosyltransferase